MARSPEDLFTLGLSLKGTVSLDWERIEQDPLFRTELAMTGDQAAALQRYLEHYIKQEVLFRNVPCTNGPGTLTLEGIETL